MIDSTTDVKQCFAQPNTDKSKYPRLICHISSIPVTDRRRVLAGESHNNNGSRDASGQWNMISNDALINECGFTQSRVHSQLFMRFAGDKDLILMQKGTDDFKILITNTPGGIALKINFMHVLEVKLGWEMTKQDLTSDYGSILHTFLPLMAGTQSH
jgi:hypothetical protein